jgi:hypothetical protein
MSRKSTGRFNDELDMAGQKKMKWGQVDVSRPNPKASFSGGNSNRLVLRNCLKTLADRKS